MKFGLSIPVTIGKNWKNKLLEILPLIEEAGISSLLVWDHYGLPEKYGIESNNTIDAWILLSFIAANTTKIKILDKIVNLHPILTEIDEILKRGFVLEDGEW